MRHVTDGELHAFLDGGLDLLPEDRGAEVRDHVASCSACQERLQDEEAVRAQATEILGDPALGEAAFPTFEELRERAEVSGTDALAEETAGKGEGRYRGPLRGLPLAWAATIVLAVGVGWMGGQVFSSLPSGQRPASSDSGVRYIRPEGPPAIMTGLDPEEETEAEALQASADVADDPTPSEAREEVAAGGARQDEVEAVPPPVSEQLIVTQARRSMEETTPVRPSALTSLDAVGVARENPRGLSVMASDSFAETPLSESGLFRAMEPNKVLGANPDSLERSLAVPGLQVETIEWEERVPGEKALLIRQLLPPGDTLELRYLGLLLGTDPQPQGRKEEGAPVEETSGGRLYANVLEASLPPGWHQVVMERDRGLLVARATISEASLKALLKSLH